jgi:hypothetical protein
VQYSIRTIYSPDTMSGPSLALGFDDAVARVADITGRPCDEVAESLSKLGSLLPEVTIEGVVAWQRPVRVEPLPEDYLALLPLPESEGGPGAPFADAVDAYVRDHGVSNAETFRRIAALTGNSPGTLSLRYRNRGDAVWRGSDPIFGRPGSPLHEAAKGQLGEQIDWL